ncbi:MAG TPA: twin-arginine translocation signal domain-containing protein, partial [Pyrinomonadaceae bacterium]|nr:twin-arginine translocation signal domain-containing protein [Pyrinomonadaceae bacterium]
MKDSKLNRRNFLKTSAIGAVSISLLANSTAKAEVTAENIALPASISERRIIPLNHRWLYSEKSSPEALRTDFNDKGFERVNIPHTNKMLPVSGFDEKEYMFVSV